MLASRGSRFAVVLGLVLAIGAGTASGAGSYSASARPQIVFIRSTQVGLPGQIFNEVWVMNHDGSDQRRLAQLAGLVAPSWSPDGRQLLFQSRQWRGETHVHAVDADGTGERRLARGGTPVWSPDGRAILFVSGRDGNSEIYVMDPDGGGQRNLTRHVSRDESPVWSPNGQRIAFVRAQGRNLVHLYVMNADGSGLRRLTREPVHDLSPTWSPDGRTIRLGRFEANADGTGLRKLGRDVPLDGRWSPDGKKLAFVGRSQVGPPPADYDVYVVNADGSERRRLTRGSAYDGDPAWSSDGRWIAFRSTRDGNPEIYVMRADGSGQRRLTDSRAHDGWLTWSPAKARSAS